jgi:DNA polymerase-1
MKRLVLIDGNAIMHRAYHALPPLTSPDGQLVNVVYGFLSVIIRLYADLKPTHMTVAFDRPGPTFRNELFDKYQENRPKADDDFISQIIKVHDAVAAFDIPIFEADGFEADDVIGTICTQAAHVLDQVIVVTGDRDLLQLVSGEKVLIFMPTKGLSEGKLYGEKEVQERMGVAPNRIADLKALMGDASDDYPGVAGIGPKTAITLLNAHGTVEDVYLALKHDDVPIGATTRKKLLDGLDSAILGKKLATIRRDAPIVFDHKKAERPSLDTPKARNVLVSLNFPSLLKRLQSFSPKAPEPEKTAKKQKPDQQALF